MGMLSYCGIDDLLHEAFNNAFRDKSVLMLGKQILYHSRQELYTYARRIGAPMDYSLLRDDGVSGNCDCYSFFYALGCREVHAMDISPYEGADIIFDLNSTEIPDVLIEHFDYIIDGGTTEHLFNFTQGLYNVAKMLKVGGKVFHYIPATGSVNHGYYSLSPQVLEDFYTNNGFRVDKLDIIMKKDGYISIPTKLEDCVVTAPDYRFYNLRDVEGMPNYVGLLRGVAVKKEPTGKIMILPKQNHWYGWINGQILYEMLSYDLSLADSVANLAIFGAIPQGKMLLDVISQHPDFSFDRFKGFFTFDADNRCEFEGFPVLHGGELLTSGINILIVAYENEEICGKLANIVGDKMQIIRLSDYSTVISR